MITRNSAIASAAEEIRQLFDIPQEVTYLNCASMGPQLRLVTEAGIAAVHAQRTPWTVSAEEWFSGAEELRTLAAQILGATSDGIAIIPAASYGIATAAANLPLSRGQRVVLLDQEFPSNVYAWRELAKKNGGAITTVQRRAGMSWTEALEQAIDARTAIVAVCQCHWTDGAKVDLERVAERARAVGAALVVDASQSAGACPLDLSRVQPDFLVTVGYKWLLGPYTLGYLYVAPKWRQSGIPLEQSWLTRAGSDNFAGLVEYTDEYRPGARRFDMGEFPQFVLAPMAKAGLKQILGWGVSNIQQGLMPLVDEIANRAADAGYSVLPPEQRCGHMIGIRHPSGLPAQLSGLLKDARVFVGFRGDSIRVAPHLYNDAADIERLFRVLKKAQT